MPTRTIRLKLVVPRDASESSLKIRRALWATHCFVNDAVRHYEELLLEMRQEDVLVRDGVEERLIDGGEWSDRLRRRLVGHGVAASDLPDALERLQGVYRAIVKSHGSSGAGSAIDAKKWHGPLVDSGSAGGEAADRRLRLLAPLAEIADDDELRQEAEGLIEAYGDLVLKSTGRPPGWVLARRKGDASWPGKLRTAVADGLKQGSGEQLRWLRDRRVVPLAEPWSRGRLASNAALNLFERTAVALATAHLNTWESWRHRTVSQHEARSQAVADWEGSFLESHRAALDRIRQWESEYSGVLEAESFWAAGSAYRILPRQVRGWTELRDWLGEHPRASAGERVARVHELQADLGGRFGSERLLKWLAAPEQQWLAEHPAGDVVTRIAEYNRRCRVLERTRKLPLYTAPDAVEHPRWAAYDPPKNSNQPPFDLLESDGRLELKIELLVPDASDGLLHRETFTLPLAPSGQLAEVRVHAGDPDRGGRSKDRRVLCRSQDGLERLSGLLGGSTLVLERRSLARAAASAGDDMVLGGVHFATVINHDDPEVAERRKRREPIARWLRSGLGKRRGGSAKLPESFSVLAADIGLRSAAAVAVLRVVPERDVGPGRRFSEAKSWPCRPLEILPGRKVVHERSALLTLPGERPDQAELARRHNEQRQLGEVSASLSILATLCRLVGLEEAGERQEVIDGLLGQSRDLIPSDTCDILSDLTARVAAGPEPWSEAALEAFLAYERALGERIKRWRLLTRPRRRQPVGGMSAWWLDHLERVRSVLIRWHRHQRPGQEGPSRLDRARWGTVAGRLLEHINHLKDDRKKTTADLIVQAARGRVYRHGRWQQVYDPVDVIILEDLARYRFRMDRPRRENSQLMRWAHRAIAAEVEEQAALYGIEVIDAPAAFSSRFDAKTGAPGVRCEAVSRQLLERLHQGHPRSLVRRLDKLGIDIGDLEPGHLLPTGHGELLVSLTPDGDLRIVHADINAAQNLGARAIEGHGFPTRISVARLPGTGQLGRVGLGKRLQGALGGDAVLATDTSDGRGETYKLRVLRGTHQLRRETGAGAAELGQLRIDLEDEQGPATGSRDAVVEDAELELRAAVLEERLASGSYVVLFRDLAQRIEQGEWVPHRRFWSLVEADVVEALRRTGRLGSS